MLSVYFLKLLCHNSSICARFVLQMKGTNNPQINQLYASIRKTKASEASLPLYIRTFQF